SDRPAARHAETPAPWTTPGQPVPTARRLVSRYSGPCPCLAGGAIRVPGRRVSDMLHILGGVALAYGAGTGLLTNAALVGRGLVRAARAAAEGNLHEAGVEVLGALVAPAALSYAAVATLVTEVVGGASDLAGEALEGTSAPIPVREAA